MITLSHKGSEHYRLLGINRCGSSSPHGPNGFEEIIYENNGSRFTIDAELRERFNIPEWISDDTTINICSAARIDGKVQSKAAQTAGMQPCKLISNEARLAAWGKAEHRNENSGFEFI